MSGWNLFVSWFLTALVIFAFIMFVQIQLNDKWDEGLCYPEVVTDSVWDSNEESRTVTCVTKVWKVGTRIEATVKNIPVEKEN